MWSTNAPILIGEGIVICGATGWMAPTMVTLTGEPMPPGWVNIKVVSEPVLGVMAKSVQ